MKHNGSSVVNNDHDSTQDSVVHNDNDNKEENTS